MFVLYRAAQALGFYIGVGGLLDARRGGASWNGLRASQAQIGDAVSAAIARHADALRLVSLWQSRRPAVAVWYAELRELCRQSNRPMPALLVAPDFIARGPLAVNALAIGAAGAQGLIVLMPGILEFGDRRRIRAVLAHELAHLERRHMAQLINASTSAQISAAIACDRLALGRLGRAAVSVAAVIGLAALQRRFEREADDCAVKSTSAADLADALESLGGAGHFGGRGQLEQLLASHDTVGTRVSRLRRVTR